MQSEEESPSTFSSIVNLQQRQNLPSISSQFVANDQLQSQSNQHQQQQKSPAFLINQIIKHNDIQCLEDLKAILLQDIHSLRNILLMVVPSSDAFFVVSEVLLKMLKQGLFRLRYKRQAGLTRNGKQIIFLEQETIQENSKKKMEQLSTYHIISDHYIGLALSKIDILKNIQYRQAIQLVSLCESQSLRNIESEVNKMHMKLILKFIPDYTPQKRVLQNLSPQPFMTPQRLTQVNPSRGRSPQLVFLYEVVCTIIRNKQNRSQNTQLYVRNQSDFLLQHKTFRDRYMNDYFQFVVSEAKSIFANILNFQYVRSLQEFQQRILNKSFHWIIKLFEQVINFSYEKCQQALNYWMKDMVVPYPQYVLPPYFADFVFDTTVVQAFHQIYLKILVKQPWQYRELIQQVFKIYGRLFFIKKQNLLDPNIKLKEKRYRIFFLKFKVLSDMMQSRQCLQFQHLYGISELVQKTIFYQVLLYKQPKAYGQIQMQSKFVQQRSKTLKSILMDILQFVEYHLENSYFKILSQYVRNQSLNSIQWKQLNLCNKLFQILKACHQRLNVFVPFTHTNLTEQGLALQRKFYQKYFRIADVFLSNLALLSIQLMGSFQTHMVQISFFQTILKVLPYKKIQYDIELKEHNRANTMTTEELLSELKIDENNIWEVMGGSNRYDDPSIKTIKILQILPKIDFLTQNIKLNLIPMLSYVKPQCRLKNEEVAMIKFYMYLASSMFEHWIVIKNKQKQKQFQDSSIPPFIQLVKDLVCFMFRILKQQDNYKPEWETPYSAMIYLLKVILKMIRTAEQRTKHILRFVISSIQDNNQESDKERMEEDYGDCMNRNIEFEATFFTQTIYVCLRRITASFDQKEIDSIILLLDQAMLCLQDSMSSYHMSFVSQIKLTQFCCNVSQQIQTILGFSSDRNNTQAACLFEKTQNVSQKRTLIVFYFAVLKRQNLNFHQQQEQIFQLYSSLLNKFNENQNVQNLVIFLNLTLQIYTRSSHQHFTLDLFLTTFHDTIKKLDKEIRKLFKNHIRFYQIAKQFLKQILGQKGVFTRQYAEVEVEADRAILIKVEDTFYTWVKQLGREELRNGLLTVDKESIQELALIWKQFMSLTPNGKLLPLPGLIMEQLTSTSLDKSSTGYLQFYNIGSEKLDPCLQQMFQIYCNNLYRLTDDRLLASLRQIDYKLEYFVQWWEEVMSRNLSPEINIAYVGSKFIQKLDGDILGFRRKNLKLFQLFYAIAKYFKNVPKYSSENGYLGTLYTLQSRQIDGFMQQERQGDYVNRVVEYWFMKYI